MRLEARVQQIGREILQSAIPHIPSALSQGGIRNIVFDWCMKDPRAATQIFRFMDVLPSLGDADILPHMQEYLLDSGVVLPVPIAAATKLAGMAPDAAVQTIKTFSERMARSFIAGDNLTLGAANFRERYGARAATFDLVGEITTSDHDADKYKYGYLAALDTLEKSYGANTFDDFGKPRINLSIKLSALDPHFDPLDPDGTSERVRDRLRPIFKKAMDIGAFINLDIEHLQYRNLANQIFKDLLSESEFKDYPYAGTVVQTVLKDAEFVYDDFLLWVKERGTPITIRLVKGAYWDHEVVLAQQNGWDIPVFTDKRDTDILYEDLTGKLFANKEWTRPALATHNARSIAVGIAYAEQVHAHARDWEIQKLFGVADEIGTALEERRYPLRDYVPCGEIIPAMGYFVRRLLENSSQQAFVRGLRKDMDISELLRNPRLERRALTTRKRRDWGKLWRWIPELARRVTGRRTMVQVPANYSAASDSGFTNEPSANFALPNTRDAMGKAIAAFDSERKGKLEYPLVIGGERVTTDETLESKNPSATAEVLGKVCVGTQGHIDQAVEAAGKASEIWRYKPVEDRVAVLHEVADEVRRRKDELSAWIIAEAGKTAREAQADVQETIDFLMYYAKEVIRLGGRIQTQEVLGEDSTVHYEALGTFAVIGPWNFQAIPAGMIAACVGAGNGVIVKPSPDSPLFPSEVVEMFRRAGVPDGLVNSVPCSIEDARYLVAHPGVHGIAFTGSAAVGLDIVKNAAENSDNGFIKRVVAELGGKNAIIVDKSADLEQAVLGVIQSAFGYSGQKCSAASRVIVMNDVYDAFVAKLVEATRSLRVGPADAVGTDVGPLINHAAYKKVTGYIGRGEQEGGNVLLRGEQTELPGFYVGPTVIGINRRNVLNREEVFGPVLAVMRAKTFDEALDIALEPQYALTGGLYSRTPSHIAQAERQFRVGNLYINRSCTGAIVERHPFGGFNMSGVGSKTGWTAYLPQFMLARTITENTARSGHIPGLDGIAVN